MENKERQQAKKSGTVERSPATTEGTTTEN